MNAIYGGERFVREGDSLTDLGSHLPGFCLDHTGLLRASLATISGHITADSLEAGPLSVSHSTPRVLQEISQLTKQRKIYLIPSGNMAYSIQPEHTVDKI
jgi:hypothetical protein